MSGESFESGALPGPPDHCDPCQQDGQSCFRSPRTLSLGGRGIWTFGRYPGMVKGKSRRSGGIVCASRGLAERLYAKTANACRFLIRAFVRAEGGEQHRSLTCFWALGARNQIVPWLGLTDIPAVLPSSRPVSCSPSEGRRGRRVGGA